MNDRFAGLRRCFTSQSARRSLCLSEDIARCVHVSVEREAAVATVNPGCQGLSDLATAAGACLTGSASIHGNDRLPSFFRFERQDANKCAPARVVNGLCHSSAGETTDVQVFDCNEIVFAHQLERCLEKEVTPAIRHTAVLAGDDDALPISATAATLAFGKFPHRSREIRFRVPSIAWILNLQAIGKRCEAEQADIDADALAGSGQGAGGNVVAGKGNPPVTDSISAERNGLDATFNGAREEQFACTHASERQTTATKLVAPTLGSIAHRVEAGPTAESREAPASKEDPERCIKVLQRLLAHRAVERADILADAPYLRQLIDLVVKGHRHTRTLPRFNAMFKRRVIEFAQKVELILGVTLGGRAEACLVFE